MNESTLTSGQTLSAPTNLEALETIERLVHAAMTFADTFDGITLADVGPHLTCRETDVLADLLRAAGANHGASTLVHYHALEDDEGDAHWKLV